MNSVVKLWAEMCLRHLRTVLKPQTSVLVTLVPADMFFFSFPLKVKSHYIAFSTIKERLNNTQITCNYLPVSDIQPSFSKSAAQTQRST